MSKNQNLSHLDPNQISTLEHDDKMDAKRVILVGGEKLDININEEKLVGAIKEGISSIQQSIHQNENIQQIQTVEKNVFIPQIEIREIEKQVFIPQIEYKTIEVPIIIKEIEFKEIVKERHYPIIITICNIVQAISVASILILNLLRK